MVRTVEKAFENNDNDNFKDNFFCFKFIAAKF